MTPPWSTTVVRTTTGALAMAKYVKFLATQSENPKADLNFGSLPAFSSSLGSASYGYTFSVTVLKKSTELVPAAIYFSKKNR